MPQGLPIHLGQSAAAGSSVPGSLTRSLANGKQPLAPAMRLLARVFVVAVALALLMVITIPCPTASCFDSLIPLPPPFRDSTQIARVDDAAGKILPEMNYSRMAALLTSFPSNPTEPWPSLDINNRTDNRDFSQPICRDVLFAYAFMGDSCPTDFNRPFLTAPYSVFFYASWSKLCNDSAALKDVFYFHEPHTTWTTGRNRLYSHILLEERRRGCQFLYHIFADADLELVGFNFSGKTYYIHSNDSSPPVVLQLQDWLIYELPLIASAGFPYYDFLLHPLQNNVSVTFSSTFFDAAFNIFSPRARQFLLPYCEAWDLVSWYHSQAILLCLNFFMFPKTALNVPMLVIRNDGHYFSSSDKPNELDQASRYVRSKDIKLVFIQAMSASVQMILNRFNRTCVSPDPLEYPSI